MPERIAFRMNLNPGFAAEYEKRHDEIFPELAEPELTHIHFENGKVERYRIPMGRWADSFEWFRRVN